MIKKNERNRKVWEISKKMKGIREWRKVLRTYMMPIQIKEQGHMKKMEESNKKIQGTYKRVNESNEEIKEISNETKEIYEKKRNERYKKV